MLRWRRPVKEKVEENQRHQLPANHQRRKSPKLQITVSAVSTTQLFSRRAVSSHGRNDAYVQQLIGYQEECCPHPKEQSFTLKRDFPQLPRVKEEEEELWITQEGDNLLGPKEADLTKLSLTGVSVKTEDHEDKQPESLRWLFPSDVQQQIGHQGEHPPQPQGARSTLKQEDSQPSQVKDEEEELWITREGEYLLEPKEADLTKIRLTVVSVKTEDDEVKPPESSQLHHSPSEENRGAEPPNRSSPQHMTTEADGDHCGGSQADNLLAPLSDSDDTTSHSPEGEDWDDTQEPLSSDTDIEGDMRAHTDNKHSECSKKKTGKKRFTCSVCAKSFSQRTNFTRHMRTHTGEKPFACSVCGQRFSQKFTMLSHMTTHTGEKPFNCSVCAQRFSRNSNMVRHMRTHTAEKPFACSVCGQRFSYQSNIVPHMRKHTGEKPFACSVCGKNFVHKANMVSHMRKHTGEKPFRCSVCSQNFSHRHNLAYHMLKHTEEKQFACSDCGQRFSQKCALVSHMRMHTGEKPFCCSVCGQRFSRHESMVKHIRTHTGEKPFPCSVCGQRFSQKCALGSHMRTHTGEKPFSCSICGQRFSRNATMVSHVRTHTGEKPFSCSVCGQRFSRNATLVSHMRTHTGEQPFGCSICGQRFSRKSNMVVHIRTHTKEKPFSCSFCSKSYSQKNSLTVHMQTHNGQ
ncbi:zinc finger protein 436-like isoform X1 [Dunckerocampus dactyliophorus]|uniref:zinc finger protein 436-like isoform X1 n=1 Tax=Dunckerocampus dactyliophorus TaxID=161453 RepID=UPI00240670AF|nr:zinc finger protein 436-like isoform X1 [Dunckerocampus dactyliophorus]